MVDAAGRQVFTRHRHETRRRRLTVARAESVTPAMRRLVLTGGNLAGFTSLSADDHVKLFVPGTEERRDYTPRYFNEATSELWIEFALHQAGPATAWAREAAEGDAIEIGGPRGSTVISEDFDWWWLIGDESALPAIARRLSEFCTGTKVTTIVAVTGPDEEQDLATEADHHAMWVHRSEEDGANPAALLEAVSGLTMPSGDGFVWMAGEAQVTRSLRQLVCETRGHPVGWTKAAGYWTAGVADTHGNIDG